jgi:crotonobetaine/carnitine-CoA ligase
MNILQFTDITQRHIGRAIAMQAEQNGDAACILYGDQRITFAEVNRRVNELAGGLAARGLAVGERVAFYMDSAPEVIFLALAANKLGAIWVPVNTDYKGAWLEDTITRSRPRILVTDAAHAARIGEVSGNLQLAHIVVLGEPGELEGAEDFGALYVPGSPEPDMSAFSYGDTCAVLWTSGTTGKSSGFLPRHPEFHPGRHAYVPVERAAPGRRCRSQPAQIDGGSHAAPGGGPVQRAFRPGTDAPGAGPE